MLRLKRPPSCVAIDRAAWRGRLDGMAAGTLWACVAISSSITADALCQLLSYMNLSIPCTIVSLLAPLVPPLLLVSVLLHYPSATFIH